MGSEIEKKFRVFEWDGGACGTGTHIEQGYLAFNPEVRVRIRGEQAFITIKGPRQEHPDVLIRPEFEYAIPLGDAKALLHFCLGRLSKTRFVAGRFEIDVFHGPLQGLVLLEAELLEPTEELEMPASIKAVDVTNDPRFLNHRLALVTSFDQLVLG